MTANKSATRCGFIAIRIARGAAHSAVYPSSFCSVMGRAERAIARRQSEEARRELEAAAAERDRVRRNRASLVAEVEALVPAALASLEAADWRGGELLTVHGKWRRKTIAAYPMGSYQYAGRWDSGPRQRNTRTIYLLSNGQWVYATEDWAEDGAMSFAAVAEWLTRGDLSDERLASEPFPGILRSLKALAGAGH